jgi:hypothetical protein
MWGVCLTRFALLCRACRKIALTEEETGSPFNKFEGLGLEKLCNIAHFGKKRLRRTRRLHDL